MGYQKTTPHYIVMYFTNKSKMDRAMNVAKGDYNVIDYTIVVNTIGKGGYAKGGYAEVEFRFYALDSKTRMDFYKKTQYFAK